MIEILKFIEDLKEIRKSMPYTNLTSTLVDDKIKKYEKEVEEFEKWAEKQNEFVDPEAGVYGIDTSKLSNEPVSELLQKGFDEEQKKEEDE